MLNEIYLDELLDNYFSTVTNEEFLIFLEKNAYTRSVFESDEELKIFIKDDLKKNICNLVKILEFNDSNSINYFSHKDSLNNTFNDNMENLFVMKASEKGSFKQAKDVYIEIQLKLTKHYVIIKHVERHFFQTSFNQNNYEFSRLIFPFILAPYFFNVLFNSRSVTTSAKSLKTLNENFTCQFETKNMILSYGDVRSVVYVDNELLKNFSNLISLKICKERVVVLEDGEIDDNEYNNLGDDACGYNRNGYGVFITKNNHKVLNKYKQANCPDFIDLYDLNNLHSLELNELNFKSFDNIRVCCNNLKEFSIIRCFEEFTVIPSHFFNNLTQLNYLHIELGIVLANIFKMLSNLSVLVIKRCVCRYNGLSLKGLKNLKELHVVESNVAKQFYNKHTFSGIQGLENLFLINNRTVGKLNNKQNLFSNLKKLKKLYIDGESIGKLVFKRESQPFKNLENLQELSIRGCYMYFVSERLFSNLTNLKTLELEGNIIKKFEKNAFDSLVNLKKIKFRRHKLKRLNS